MHQDGHKFGETSMYTGKGLSSVERSIAPGGSKNIKPSGLWEKAFKGKTSDFQKMVKNKQPLDVNDNHRRTPLHWAAAGGHEDLCQFLVSNGCNLNAQDFVGESVTPCRPALALTLCVAAAHRHRSWIRATRDTACQERREHQS
jgi:hypothetical protein